MFRRFIPTRVGNTTAPVSCVRPRAVHPHACGEYIQARRNGIWRDGSSPRVWGIRTTVTLAMLYLRFIPTRVGNTTSAVPRFNADAVHPHACGEYSRTVLRTASICGSSPRVWGIPLGEVTNPTGRRFIPTRVGNTHGWPTTPRLHPVHPHACGEYDVSAFFFGHISGSSPRVWGILSPYTSQVLCNRFIPTRVGNTNCDRFPLPVGPVHPHACGEYGSRGTHAWGASGSSPRVWGIRYAPIMTVM